MNSKKLSPAYLTSLLLIVVGALLISLSQTWLLWLGWILVLAALGLNVLAHMVTISKAQGEPTPALVTSLSEMENNLVGAMRDKNAERHDSREGDDGAYDGEEENSASDEAAQSSTRESDASLKTQRSTRLSPTLKRSLKVCYEHKIPSLTRISMLGGTADSRCCAQWRKVYADRLDFLYCRSFPERFGVSCLG